MKGQSQTVFVVVEDCVGEMDIKGAAVSIEVAREIERHAGGTDVIEMIVHESLESFRAEGQMKEVMGKWSGLGKIGQEMVIDELVRLGLVKKVF